MAGPFEYVLTRSVCRGVLAACAHRRARGPANAHVGPMTCAWVRHLAHLEVYVRIKGLTRISSGSRASYMPGRAPLCPKRRPPQPQHPIFNVFHRGGLQFGRLTIPNRDLTATKWGDLHH